MTNHPADVREPRSPAPSRAVPVAPIDLSTPQRLHVVGVGGPGMSAIAIVLAGMGHDVSECG